MPKVIGNYEILAKWTAGWTPRTDADRFMVLVYALAREDLPGANAAVAAVEEHPLVAPAREKIRELEVGVEELAAEKAWPALAAAGAKPCEKPEQGKVLAGELAKYTEAHGSTKFAASRAADREKWAAMAKAAQIVNFFVNPGFETGILDGWIQGKYMKEVVPGGRTGKYALAYGGYFSLSQKVQLVVGQHYRLRYWIKINELGKDSLLFDDFAGGNPSAWRFDTRRAGGVANGTREVEGPDGKPTWVLYHAGYRDSNADPNWQKEVPVKAGRTYEARARSRARGLGNQGEVVSAKKQTVELSFLGHYSKEAMELAGNEWTWRELHATWTAKEDGEVPLWLILRHNSGSTGSEMEVDWVRVVEVKD